MNRASMQQTSMLLLTLSLSLYISLFVSSFVCTFPAPCCRDAGALVIDCSRSLRCILLLVGCTISFLRFCCRCSLSLSLSLSLLMLLLSLSLSLYVSSLSLSTFLLSPSLCFFSLSMFPLSLCQYFSLILSSVHDGRSLLCFLLISPSELSSLTVLPTTFLLCCVMLSSS